MSSSLQLPMLVSFIFGYLLGSIPSGLLLTKAAGLGDVRNIGSGNIGATNVLRTGNKQLAALTLFLDGFKGYLAVALAGSVIAPMLFSGAEAVVLGGTGSGSQAIQAMTASLQARIAHLWALMMIAGLGAFLGHIYPVWLGFKGGKGVATYIGVLLGLTPKVGLAFCCIWLAVAFVTRYSSLSSLVASVATPIVLYWLDLPQAAFLFSLMSGLLFFKHRENISRLLKGTESKIGARSNQQEPA